MVKTQEQELTDNTDFQNIENYYFYRIIKFYSVDNLNLIFDQLKGVEIEKFIFENGILSVYFFDYTFLSFFLKNYNNVYSYGIFGDLIEKNILLAFQAGGSRHVFLNEIEEDRKLLKGMDNEKNKEVFIQLFKLKNLESHIYNQEKKIFHFKFTDFKNAMDFANHLRKINRKFGFQRKKGENLFSQLRTLYLGNIPDDMEVKSIVDNIKGGEIFTLRFLREKKCAFLTFINPFCAEVFLQYYTNNQLLILGKPIKVMKGNQSNIPLQHLLNIYAGMTRVLVLKNFDRTDFFEREEAVNNIYRKEDMLIVETNGIPDAITLKNTVEEKFNIDVQFAEDRCGETNFYEYLHEMYANLE